MSCSQVGGSAVQKLLDAGLVVDVENVGRVFCFSGRFFSLAEVEHFLEYKAAVLAHEDRRSKVAGGEVVDPILLRVLDQKRSRLHNGLADRLMERLAIEGWDHEQFRRWVAAMVRHELPWLRNRVLDMNDATVDCLATVCPPGDPS